MKRILVHYTFTPKYRRAVMVGEVHDLLHFLVYQAARQRRIEVAEIAIQPDHVHLLCYLPPTLSVSSAAGFIKWYTSLNLRRELGKRRLVSSTALWGVDFFVKSVGGDEAAQREYIRRQGF
jgi:putative transposase